MEIWHTYMLSLVRQFLPNLVGSTLIPPFPSLPFCYLLSPSTPFSPSPVLQFSLCSLPNPAKQSGEHSKLPSGVRGRAPDAKTFSCMFLGWEIAADGDDFPPQLS